MNELIPIQYEKGVHLTEPLGVQLTKTTERTAVA
jgi:hypothetical protein